LFQCREPIHRFDTQNVFVIAFAAFVVEAHDALSRAATIKPISVTVT